jgi:hypothetical protein
MTLFDGGLVGAAGSGSSKLCLDKIKHMFYIQPLPAALNIGGGTNAADYPERTPYDPAGKWNV